MPPPQQGYWRACDLFWVVTWTIRICDTQERINSLLPSLTQISAFLRDNRQPILHSLGLPILGFVRRYSCGVGTSCTVSPAPRQSSHNAKKEKERDLPRARELPKSANSTFMMSSSSAPIKLDCIRPEKLCPMCCPLELSLFHFE